MAAVAEVMEVEDEVVGVREVMVEVGTEEAVAAAGREGEQLRRIDDGTFPWKILMKLIIILGEVAMMVDEVVGDMVVPGEMIGEVVVEEEEVGVEAQ